MLIATFPFGMARNATIMYWLPVLIVTFHVFERKYVFVLSLFVGLLVLFPFLDNFRYFSGEISFSSVNLNYLNTMNFDASQEFMSVLKLNIITWGNQILGPLFFFIPRSVWPSKPIGSGALLGNTQYVFNNISMPFFAEGYINFGFWGILLFVVITALLCARLDKWYWDVEKSNSKNVFYLVFLGAIIFIMRGDLISAYAYTIGVLFSCYFTKKLILEKTINTLSV